uniref:FERM domain-containing protein n=1 Tax=Timema douglasi TaxID=61478 RepID=A0A7R8VFY7_TIMDO|nr:unnamed protein product [Timema douglasi]
MNHDATEDKGQIAASSCTPWSPMSCRTMMSLNLSAISTRILSPQDSKSQLLTVCPCGKSPEPGTHTCKKIQNYCKQKLNCYSKKAVGSDLYEQVFYSLDLIEKDYFGLQYTDPNNVQHWLDPTKAIKKQVKIHLTRGDLSLTGYGPRFPSVM